MSLQVKTERNNSIDEATPSSPDKKFGPKVPSNPSIKSKSAKKREATMKQMLEQAKRESNYVAPTSIVKEIAEDIYLTKELIYPQGYSPVVQLGESTDEGHLPSPQQGGFQYAFYVTNDSLKEVNFTADFSGSENCTWSGHSGDMI